MKTVVISKNFETVNIPFGDGTSFDARADVRQENIIKCFEIIKKNSDQAEKLKAMEEGAKLEAATAKLMSELIIQLIGEKSYMELIYAIAGDDAEPKDANFAISILWVEFVELVKERQMRFANTKAAHYLSEYVKAQSIEAD